MGSIVLSTIAENVKSFFGKEDELLHNPKAVPEAASEVFEHPGQQLKKIVEKPLPEKKDLPFSPDQLRNALKKKQPEKEPEPIHEDISHFESALEDVHTVHEERQLNEVPEEQPKEIPPIENEGFFSEFERFVLNEDYGSDTVENMDIVHRMREFHNHQKEGKEYYVYSKDIQHAINRKMQELKLLENEWFHTRKQIDELESGLSSIELEVETRSTELKTLLKQAKEKSRLETQVTEGDEFILYDGRKLKSLLDLKIALRTMPDEVFRHHVSAKTNDFAAWVEHSLGDAELGKELEPMQDCNEMTGFFSKLLG